MGAVMANRDPQWPMFHRVWRRADLTDRMIDALGVDPIVAGWRARGDVPKPYDAFSKGPTDADQLMRRDGREWRGIQP